MLTESDATTSISNTKCESGGGQQDEGEEQRRSLLQKACVLPARSRHWPAGSGRQHRRWTRKSGARAHVWLDPVSWGSGAPPPSFRPSIQVVVFMKALLQTSARGHHKSTSRICRFDHLWQTWKGYLCTVVACSTLPKISRKAYLIQAKFYALLIPAAVLPLVLHLQRPRKILFLSQRFTLLYIYPINIYIDSQHQ